MQIVTKGRGRIGFWFDEIAASVTVGRYIYCHYRSSRIRPVVKSTPLPGPRPPPLRNILPVNILLLSFPYSRLSTLYKHTVYKHYPPYKHAGTGPDQICMAQIHSPYKLKRSVSIRVPVPVHACKKRRLYSSFSAATGKGSEEVVRTSDKSHKKDSTPSPQEKVGGGGRQGGGQRRGGGRPDPP